MDTSSKTTKNFTIYTITQIGIFAALTCILGPLSIPLPFNLVPITLTNFIIYLAVYLLGTKKGTISFLIYLLLGTVGLPVFSGFSGGPAKLFGPTGGYLIGFIFMALISGFFMEHWHGKRSFSFLGMLLGTAICYLLGTLWLGYQLHVSFYTALGYGVFPFIAGDLVKIILALLLAPQIKRRLPFLK